MMIVQVAEAFLWQPYNYIARQDVSLHLRFRINSTRLRSLAITSSLFDMKRKSALLAQIYSGALEKAVTEVLMFTGP
jgi:hypothetical protein